MSGVDPAHPLLLFDGVCNFCHGIVRFLLERDRSARLRFAPIQSDLGRRLLGDAGLDPDALDTVVLIDADGAHTRSDAGLRAVRLLGPPWSLLFALRAVPRPLRDAAYGVVAAARHRLAGRSNACDVPPPEIRERMI
jgi:predicted DCC family thiol-disulfide oxidoreductase YuxK